MIAGLVPCEEDVDLLLPRSVNRMLSIACAWLWWDGFVNDVVGPLGEANFALKPSHFSEQFRRLAVEAPACSNEDTRVKAAYAVEAIQNSH